MKITLDGPLVGYLSADRAKAPETVKLTVEMAQGDLRLFAHITAADAIVLANRLLIIASPDAREEETPATGGKS